MNLTSVNINNKDEREVTEIILTNINNITKDNFYTSEIYNVNNVKKFKSKKINLSEDILNTLTKISDFYKSLETQRFYGLENKQLEKEYEYINDKGIHCIYFSTLAKLIVKKLHNIDLNLVQGYYKFENNAIASFIFGKYSIGVHSWLEYDGGVIDLTFNTQQSSSYNSFENVLDGSNIIGEFTNIDFIGYVETQEIINKYINDFLSINNISLDEWLNFHMELFNL